MFSSTQKLPTKRMTTTSTTILLAVVTVIVLADYAASADMADSRDASKLAFAGTPSALPNSVAIQHDEKRSLRSDDTATAEAAEERVSLHVPLDAPLQGKINGYLAFGFPLGETYESAKYLRAILMKDFLHANPTEKFRHTIPTEQSDMHIIEHILDKLHQKVPNSKPGPLNNVVEKTSKAQHAGSSPVGQDAQAKLKIEELKYTLFQNWHNDEVDPSTLLKTSSGWKGKYKELLTSFASDYQKFKQEHGSKSGDVAKEIVRKARAKLSHPENVTPPVETQVKKSVAASSDRTNEYNDKYSRQWSGKLNHEEGGKVQEGWPRRGEREEGKREEGWKHKEREELKEGEPKRGEREEGKLKEGEIHAGEIHEGHLGKGKLKEADELKEGEPKRGEREEGWKHKEREVLKEGWPQRGRREEWKLKEGWKRKEREELKEGWPQRGRREGGKWEGGWKRKEREELKEGEPQRGRREEWKLKEGWKRKEREELKEGWPQRGRREEWKREGGWKRKEREELKEGWPQRGRREEGKREGGGKHKEREELKEREPKRGKIDKGKLKEGEFYEGDVGRVKLQGGELKEGDPNLVELKKREAEEWVTEGLKSGRVQTLLQMQQRQRLRSERKHGL